MVLGQIEHRVLSEEKQASAWTPVQLNVKQWIAAEDTYLSVPENLVLITRIRSHQRVHSGHLNNDLDLILDVCNGNGNRIRYQSYARWSRHQERTSVVNQAHKGLTPRPVTDKDYVDGIRQPGDINVSRPPRHHWLYLLTEYSYPKYISTI
jgi:hypothetical protein